MASVRGASHERRRNAMTRAAELSLWVLQCSGILCRLHAVRWVLDMLSLQIYIETERDQMMVQLGWIALELTAYVLESYCICKANMMQGYVGGNRDL